MLTIFVNPNAGKGKALKIAAVLEISLAEKQIPFTVYTQSWPDNLAQCSEAWVVGGDGTLNYFINKYQSVNIPLAIFKGGTGDDFAWQLYGTVSLQQQIEIVLASKGKQVDAGICNGKIFVNTVGIGFDGDVLKSMGMIRKLGHHLGYLLIVIKKIFSFREFEYKIEVNGHRLDNKYLLVNIANARRTGGGFMVSPAAKIDDGHLDLVLCKPLSVLKRLLFLPKIEKGKHLFLPFIIHEKVKTVTISCDQEKYGQLDGELIGAQQFHIKILPAYFLFKY